MRLFVSQRRHRAEYIALAESYRDRIAEAEKRARKAEDQFASLVKAVSTHTDIHGTVTLAVRLEPVFLREGNHYEFAERIACRVTEVLYGVHRDWRRNWLTGEPLDLRAVANREDEDA